MYFIYVNTSSGRDLARDRVEVLMLRARLCKKQAKYEELKTSAIAALVAAVAEMNFTTWKSTEQKLLQRWSSDRGRLQRSLHLLQRSLQGSFKYTRFLPNVCPRGVSDR